MCRFWNIQGVSRTRFVFNWWQPLLFNSEIDRTYFFTYEEVQLKVGLVLSDEATFILHSHVNRPSCRYWATKTVEWKKLSSTVLQNSYNFQQFKSRMPKFLLRSAIDEIDEMLVIFLVTASLWGIDIYMSWCTSFMLKVSSLTIQNSVLKLLLIH